MINKIYCLNLKPSKKQIVKAMKQDLENKSFKERCASVPVDLERMKFRNVTHAFFQKPTKKRKIYNSASCHSTLKVDSNCITIETEPMESMQKSKL